MRALSRLFQGMTAVRFVQSKTRVPENRRLSLEQLETRALLCAAPSLLADFSAAEAGIETLRLGDVSSPVQDQPVELSNAMTASGSPDESFDIVYETLETGNVRVLGQTGLQKISTMNYCAITDSIYLDLWEKAIGRWEEAISVGVEDTTYPYAVDGQTGLQIDDLYLYFGFSDSFSSSSSLGSALNAGYYRANGYGAAATGSLVFNAKYFTNNPSESVKAVFYNTALHEVAHALGYNITHFEKLNLLESSSETPYALDELFDDGSSYFYHYVGENGVGQYLRAFPDDMLGEATSQDKFLMETYDASGSFGAHPSSVLGTYYLYLNVRDGMTYSISPLFEATITPMTLGVLEDLGYTVDYNFADALGTPAPQNLTTQTVGKTVVLNWEKSAGDLSNSASGDARYQIERIEAGALDGSGAEDGWTVIATDVEGTSYYDTTVEAGQEYVYRVRACYIRSNQEVGVYRAQAGDLLEWNSDESKFTIYALVNNGSNMLGWTRVVSSTSSKSWTVTNLSKRPDDGVTLFRVVAVGAILDDTDPSCASRAAVDDNANLYVPDGYSVDDWRALKDFLELTDENGVKNGRKIDPASYSPDLLQDFTGLTWREVDGVYRLSDVSWNDYGLVGDLDLSACSELSSVVVNNNSLSQLELNSAALTIVNASANELTTLDVTPLAALESLSCSGNAITSLDLSGADNLVYLDCSDNALSSLNLAAAGSLTTLKCANNQIETLSVDGNTTLRALYPWSESLANVYLPSGFSGTVNLSGADAESFRWTKNDETVGEASSLQFDGADETVVATIGDDATRQTVSFYVGDSEPREPAGALRFVLQSLSSDASDSFASAAANQRTWLDEWSNFYVDVWANADGAPVLSVVATFSCDVAYFAPVDVEAAPGYTVEHAIDSGVVSFSATGDGLADSAGWSLIARMKFAPVGGAGVALPDDGITTAVDPGFAADPASQSLNGVSAAVVSVPSPALYPVIFDLDENGVVNTNDLGYCLAVMGQNTDEIDVAKYRVLDYDQNGAVNTNDLAFFLQAMGGSDSDGLDSAYLTEPATTPALYKRYETTPDVITIAETDQSYHYALEGQNLEIVDASPVDGLTASLPTGEQVSITVMKTDVDGVVSKVGDVVLQLFSADGEAPISSARFLDLVSSGYYEGLSIHRILSDFVFQGGSPTGDGAGGSGRKIADEYSDVLTHSRRGMIAYANSGPGTSDAQFYVTFAAAEYLDGNYNVFGYIVDGYDVLEALEGAEVVADRRGEISQPVDAYWFDNVHVVDGSDVTSGVLRLVAAEGASGVTTLSVSATNAAGETTRRQTTVYVGNDGLAAYVQTALNEVNFHIAAGESIAVNLPTTFGDYTIGYTVTASDAASQLEIVATDDTTANFVVSTNVDAAQTTDITVAANVSEPIYITSVEASAFNPNDYPGDYTFFNYTAANGVASVAVYKIVSLAASITQKVHIMPVAPSNALLDEAFAEFFDTPFEEF
ncbi:MAG: peptidylprolyl isomerase [Thermoguttaceae bacterium]|nr:peptidylprolyl isomerase [Thermoguttaceae bacterium]